MQLRTEVSAPASYSGLAPSVVVTAITANCADTAPVCTSTAQHKRQGQQTNEHAPQDGGREGP